MYINVCYAVVKYLHLPIEILRCPLIVVLRTESENILLAFANVSAFFIEFRISLFRGRFAVGSKLM